jgi:hypothetical protein
MEVTLPASLPEKYRVAIVRAAEGCKVKKTIAASPLIEVVAIPGPSAITDPTAPAYAQQR